MRAISATKDVTFSSQREEEELVKNDDMKNKAALGDDQPSLSQLPEGDDHNAEEGDLDEEDDEVAALKSEKELVLGPQFSLKEQLEKDKVCVHFSSVFFFFSFFKSFINVVQFITFTYIIILLRMMRV